MAKSKLYSRYYISLKISLIYLVISATYIVFSDHIITSIFEKNLSVEHLTTIQTYKGLGFVFITSVFLFVLIQREIKAKRIYIRELENQKDSLLGLAEENEMVKKRLQDRNIYIETILKNLPLGLAVNKIDDGKTIFMNNKFTKIYGWPENYLDTQTSFFNHVYPDENYRRTIKKQILEDIESGDTKRMRWEGIEITTRSREKRLVNAQNIPVYKQNLMISLVQDVTRQKRTEKRIIESEKRFRAIFENSLTALLVTNDTGDYLSVNEAAIEMFGYPREEFLSMNVRDLKVFPDNLEQKYKKYIKKGLEKGELDFQTKTGEARTGLYHAVRVSENFNFSAIMDITDLKKHERELRRSELLLNETGQLSKVGGWDLDLKTMTPYFTSETYRIYEIEEEKPPRVEDGINFYAPEAREKVQQVFNQAIENHTSYDIEVPFITAKGRRIWVRTIGQVEVVDGKAVRLYGAIQDITVQKESALELQRSEEKYRLLAENTTDVISLLDGEGRFIYVSPSVKNVSGYEPAELLGKKSYIFFHPDDVQLVTADSYWDRLESGNSITLIYRFKSKHGSYGWFESTRQPVLNDKKELIKIVSISRDITGRVEQELEIENYHRTLKKLTTELSLVEEKQRKEIAVNIHDHLSQLLVVSMMKLTDIKEAISGADTQTELATVMNYISEALENTRKITYDLSPPILYELGLIEAMHWLTEKIQNEHHLKTEFKTDLNEIELPESKLILIFRIIQELVNNTVKHAMADFLKIEINEAESLLTVLVSDNGVGFNVKSLTNAKIGKGRFGLFAIRERVQILDGKISIHSENGKGTEVEFCVPTE